MTPAQPGWPGSAKRIFVLLTLALSACSLAPQIKHNVSDYHQVFAQSADTVVVDNILRASYSQPLHFSILSKINGTISTSVSVSVAAPFGEGFPGGSSRDGVSPQFSIGSSPSFEVDTLETRNFTAGILAPGDPERMKAFMDAGLDSRVALMLFVSGIRLKKGNVSGPEILNDPASRRWVCYFGTPDKSLAFTGPYPSSYDIRRTEKDCTDANGVGELEMFSFLRLINKIGPFYLNEFLAEVPVGPPVKTSTLQSSPLSALTGLDPNKIRILANTDGKTYSVYALQKQVALCDDAPESGGTALLSGIADPRCQPNLPAVLSASDSSTGTRAFSAPSDLPSAGGAGYRIAEADLRSVAGMFDYVGGVVAYERANGACLTVDDIGGENCNGSVLFRLRGPLEDAAFTINYAGASYGIGSPSPCLPMQGNENGPCDDSNDVINILALSLGLNIQASDIPQTPIVQLVP
jgi:hypothetical protein